jgi:hypothetical protein
MPPECTFSDLRNIFFGCTLAFMARGIWQPAHAQDYDPYGSKAKAAQEQVDAADPQINAMKDRALKVCWKCVRDFAAGNNRGLDAAQKSIGPQCNQMAMSILDNQIWLYKNNLKNNAAVAHKPNLNTVLSPGPQTSYAYKRWAMGCDRRPMPEACQK